MSGHSKWHNIQGRKNAQDAKRGKIFQKISRDLYQAAKAGDPDPDNNPQLRLVMDKARAANMPKQNIQRAIDKATGAGGANFEEITYEGYGPGGVAVMVFCLTDNKNRTAAAIRSAFTHSGGSLGATGSVSYMFNRQGLIEILRDGLDKDEDDMLMDALDSGADAMQATDDKLQEQGYELETAEVTMIPENKTKVPADKVGQYQHLIDELEDNDDVADVYEAAFVEDADQGE